MAVVKLSDTWVVNDYKQISQSSIAGQATESPPLSALTHQAWPGLTWNIQLYPRGDSKAKPTYASVFVKAHFGSAEDSVTSVWAERTLTVVTGGAKADLRRILHCKEYVLGGTCSLGYHDAFLQEALTSALTDGKLALKLDLTLFKIVDLLKCRESVRAILSANQHVADRTFNVEGKSFKAHKAILANRCPGLRGPASVPLGTTADAFEAFLGAIYSDKFDFGSNWKLSLGVFELADKFGAADLKEFCDDALGGLILSLGYPGLLQALPEAFRCNASVAKAACIRGLMEVDLLSSAEWREFKASVSTDILVPMFEIQNQLAKAAVGEPVSTVFHAAELKLSHTWAISSADILKAILPQPTFVPSPVFLEHKAFPALKWQLEFYPRGNVKDPDHLQGYASLYLKAIFGPKNADLKAVYASWKASVTTKDGLEICVLATPGSILYTGAKEMTFGFAKAFLYEQHTAALEANNSGLEISLDLTIASIPEILKCRGLISSLRLDTEYADVDIDVNGTIFKAHKFILAARSKEFARMFEAEISNGTVQMEDATPEAFKSLLAAIYYESWDFLSDTDATISVLKLAESYGVADIKRYCHEALLHFTKKSNVFTILPVALKYNSAATKAACVKILLASECWKKDKEWIAFKKENVPIAYSIAEAIGECCKDKSQSVPEIPSAPTAKLSATWPIEDYAQLLKSGEPGKGTELRPSEALTHYAFPGLTWRVKVDPDDSIGKNDHAFVIVYASFAEEGQSVNSIRANWTLTVTAGDANICLANETGVAEYLHDGHLVACVLFDQHAAQSAVKLQVKLDLTLINIGELLKCRDIVRGLLKENQHADFTVMVEGQPISVHRAILAKRCGQFLERVPVGTTSDAYSAFLGAVYCDSFEFRSKWNLALGVLGLSVKFMAPDVKKFCDVALAELIPTLDISDVLKVLPALIQHRAKLTKAACWRILVDKKADEKSPDFQAICDALKQLGKVAWPTSDEAVPRAPDVQLNQTWSISGDDLSKAIASRPPAAVTGPLLEHKPIADLNWQFYPSTANSSYPSLSFYLEFYPRGNSQDSDHKPGFASLYLKAIFGSCCDDTLKAVYAKWTAVVTFADGQRVTVPAAPEFNVYSKSGEAKFGYANAFQWEQFNTSAQASKSSSSPIDIRLDLTIATIPHIIKCHGLISSLHSDKIHADVDIDVNGTVIKAHKFLLAARFEVFAGTFGTATKESKTGKVEVKDTTPEAFKAFLAAVYCNCWDFLADVNATLDVLVLAERYGVVDLKRYCDNALANFADKDNVFDILSHAAIHDATATKSACVKILVADDLMASKRWADFKEHNEKIAFDVVEATGDYFRTLKH